MNRLERERQHDAAKGIEAVERGIAVGQRMAISAAPITAPSTPGACSCRAWQAPCASVTRMSAPTGRRLGRSPLRTPTSARRSFSACAGSATKRPKPSGRWLVLLLSTTRALPRSAVEAYARVARDDAAARVTSVFGSSRARSAVGPTARSGGGLSRWRHDASEGAPALGAISRGGLEIPARCPVGAAQGGRHACAPASPGSQGGQASTETQASPHCTSG